MKRMSNVILAASIAMAAIALPVAGQQPTDRVTTGDVQKANKQAIGTMQAYTKQQHDDFVASTQRDLADMKSKIDELGDRAKTANKQEKAKLDRTVAQLRAKQRAATKQLDEYKAAKEQEWKDHQAKVERAMEDVKQGYAKAKAEFK